MTFEEWFEQEGRVMVDGGCSHEVVARAAFFVASQPDCKGVIIVGDRCSRIPGLTEKALQALIDLGVEYITADHWTFVMNPIRVYADEPTLTNECNHRQYGPPVKGRGGKIKRW